MVWPYPWRARKTTSVLVEVTEGEGARRIAVGRADDALSGHLQVGQLGDAGATDDREHGRAQVAGSA